MSRVDLLSVEFSNFMPFGNKKTCIDLNHTGITEFVGVNKDVGVDGESRNGAGKTGIMNAIIFALYGVSSEPRLKTDGHINFENGKGLFVALNFKKDGVEYRIERKRKPTSLTLVEVGGKSLTLDRMDNTTAEIVNLIGFTYEEFMMLFYQSPNRPSFMVMKPSEQRDMLESMLNLDVLSQRDASLKLMGDEFNSEIMLLERDLTQMSTTNQQTLQNIEQTKSRATEYDITRQNNITRCENELSELRQIDVSTQLRYHDINDEIHAQNNARHTEIAVLEQRASLTMNERGAFIRDVEQYESVKRLSDNFDVEKLQVISGLEEELTRYDLEFLDMVLKVHDANDALNAELNLLRNNQSNLGSTIDGLNQRLNVLDNDIASARSGVCGACNQQLHDNALLDRLNTERASYEADRNGKHTELEECRNNISNLQREIELNDEVLVLTRMDILNQQAAAKQCVINLENARKSENGYEGQLAGFDVTCRVTEQREQNMKRLTETLQTLNAEIKHLRQMIDGSSKELVSVSHNRTTLNDIAHRVGYCESELTRLRSDKNPYFEQISMLESSIVDTVETEKSIEVLSRKVSHVKHLRRLLTDSKSFIRKSIISTCIPYVNQQILLYSQELDLPHIVQINSDLSVDIEYRGKDASVFNMSNGERMRLNLATNTALRDIARKLGNEINVMMIDEVFDSSLDSSGMYKGFEFIRKRCDNILMITHRDELRGFMDRKITITKEHGFSTVN